MSYRSCDVCALTGATYRQLDWWCRQGRLGPGRTVGSGMHRSFSFADLVVVRAWVLASAVGAGFGERYANVYHDIVEALGESRTLIFYWLMLEADRGRVVMGILNWSSAAAIVVDLEACVRYIVNELEGVNHQRVLECSA